MSKFLGNKILVSRFGSKLMNFMSGQIFKLWVSPFYQLKDRTFRHFQFPVLLVGTFLVYFESFSFRIVDQGFTVEKVFHGPVDVGGDVEVRFRFRIFRNRRARGVNHLGVDVENGLPAEGSAANRTGHLLAWRQRSHLSSKRKVNSHLTEEEVIKWA